MHTPRPSDTLDAVRDQVAQTIVLRALRDAEVVDGTKVGVVFTLPHPSGEQFLLTIASHMKRATLLKDPAASRTATARSTLLGTGAYLFILALSWGGHVVYRVTWYCHDPEATENAENCK